MEKKKNIWKYFLKMLLIFVAYECVTQLFVGLFVETIQTFKYGTDIIAEGLMAALALILVLIYKNKYIFSKNREKLFDSLKIGWPFFAISGILFLYNMYQLIFVSEFVILHKVLIFINLILFCFLIGIAEEFLCRGWLLNEFLEKNGDTNKGVIMSIVFSSLIFGLMHITNAFSSSQNLFDTIMQIISATLAGISFALIYYRTKNIWSVVIIHAFWDFSIFVGDAGLLVECTTGDVTSGVRIYTYAMMAIEIIAQLFIIIWLYKKSDLVSNTEDAKKKKYYIFPIIAVFLWLFTGFYTTEEYENYHICPTYESKYLGDEIESRYYSYKSFDIEYVAEPDKLLNSIAVFNTNPLNYNFRLYLNEENGKTYFKNLMTNDEIEITDKTVMNAVVINNNSSYAILLQTDRERVLYSSFNKNNMNNSKEYLETVKKSLTEFIVPPIDDIGSMSLKDNDYNYAIIYTESFGKLYFSDDGKLYYNYKK